jgi:hypothetical protein
MKTRFALCVVAAMALASARGFAAPPDATKAAVAGATAWLSLIDDGRYADSWKEASSFFRGSIGQSRWIPALDAARKPLGKRLVRTLDRATETMSPPGAPAGRYVVMQFKTSFQGRASAIETVTFVLDKDGKWRSAGYYIK